MNISTVSWWRVKGVRSGSNKLNEQDFHVYFKVIHINFFNVTKNVSKMILLNGVNISENRSLPFVCQIHL